jgi:hypothetical protein
LCEWDEWKLLLAVQMELLPATSRASAVGEVSLLPLHAFFMKFVSFFLLNAYAIEKSIHW